MEAIRLILGTIIYIILVHYKTEMQKNNNLWERQPFEIWSMLLHLCINHAPVFADINSGLAKRLQMERQKLQTLRACQQQK